MNELITIIAFSVLLYLAAGTAIIQPQIPITQRQRTKVLQSQHTDISANEEIATDIFRENSEAGDTTDDFSPIRLIQRCPVDLPACVEMTISASDLDSVLKSRSAANAVGYTEFVVLAIGRLADGPIATYEVSLTGYTQGLECTSFGQSLVAVAGVLESGQTKLLTEAGEFLMEPDGLSVGCTDCVAPSNGRSFRRSPSWDMWLVGLEREQLFQTEDGTLGVEQPDACILMSDDFEYVSSEECEKLKSSTPLEVEFGACT